MAKRAKRGDAAPIETISHHDKRKNIPTEELRDFVADAEEQPKVVLYPRDPSLDPQLVWRGKDEQDQRDLGRARGADLHPGENPSVGDHR